MSHTEITIKLSQCIMHKNVHNLKQTPSKILSLLEAKPFTKAHNEISVMVKFGDIRMVTDRNDRRNFIKKVYLILLTQMSFTTILFGIVVGVEKLKLGIQSVTTVAIVAAAPAFFLVALVFCFANISRRYPINYTVLTLFTIFESYVIAFICSNYSSLAVLSAAFNATGICLSLFLYAHFTRYHFTFTKGFIIANPQWRRIFLIFWLLHSMQ